MALPPEMHAAAVRTCSIPGVALLQPEPRRLAPAQIAAYLDRLGLPPTAASEPTLESLSLLQSAHCDRIAYENLDLYAEGGEPLALPPLSPQEACERVTAQQRGGYCFLLVDAFAALLCSLGFQVSMHAAGVGEDPLPDARWGNHIVLVAHIGGRSYVADVGLGDGPGLPFELAPHEWEENGFRYKLEERGAGLWRFVHDQLGSFKGFDVDLSTSAAGAEEFSSYHAFYWTHPSSSYRTSGPVLQRMSPAHGIVEMRSVTLRRLHPSLEGGAEVLATAEDEERWFDLLRQYFTLPLAMMSPEQRASLWQVAWAKHKAWQKSREVQ